MKKKNKFLIFGFFISVVLSVPAYANETSTGSASTECGGIPTGTQITTFTNKIVEIQKLRTQIKLTKIESSQLAKTITKLTDLLSFDCSKISQSTWDNIKSDRQKNLEKALADFDKLYGKLIQMKPKSISCYKDGVMKTVSGKNPVCPKGYQKLS